MAYGQNAPSCDTLTTTVSLLCFHVVYLDSVYKYGLRDFTILARYVEIDLVTFLVIVHLVMLPRDIVHCYLEFKLRLKPPQKKQKTKNNKKKHAFYK